MLLLPRIVFHINFLGQKLVLTGFLLISTQINFKISSFHNYFVFTNSIHYEVNNDLAHPGNNW